MAQYSNPAAHRLNAPPGTHGGPAKIGWAGVVGGADSKCDLDFLIRGEDQFEKQKM